MSKITYYRGDDNTISLEFTQDDVAVDIDGWTIFFTIKRNLDADDDDADLAKEVTDHTDAGEGETEIVLTDTETNGLSGDYYYDIQYKDDSGLIKTVLKGTIEFVEDVTRRIA